MTKAKIAELFKSINENFESIINGLKIANSNSAHLAEVIANTNANITNVNQDLEAQLGRIRVDVEERLAALEAQVAELKEQEDALAGVTGRLEEMRKKAEGAGKAVGLAQAEEGKKRMEELNKALKEQEEILKRINAEGARRVAMGKIPVMPGLETIAAGVPLPKIELISPAQLEKDKESLEELSQEALRRGIKARDEFWDWELRKAGETMRKIDQMNERRVEEQKRQYEHMVDSIREGAGRVFDAMLTKGESVFSSLARFAEGVLQTMLRGVFQNAVTGLLTGRPGGALSSIMGIGGATATGALGGIVRGGGGARLQESIVSGGGGFASKLGGLFGMGGGGAAGAVGLGGTLAAGAATAGIATAVALGASFISGLFQGGANRRAEEAARRAGVIQAQQFAAPETITRYGIAGGAGYTVESDLTGSIRGIGRVPVVNNYVEVQLIDARHAREAGEVIGQEVSRQILQGGSLLSDNIQWAAS